MVIFYPQRLGIRAVRPAEGVQLEIVRVYVIEYDVAVLVIVLILVTKSNMNLGLTSTGVPKYKLPLSLFSRPTCEISCI